MNKNIYLHIKLIALFFCLPQLVFAQLLMIDTSQTEVSTTKNLYIFNQDGSFTDLFNNPVPIVVQGTFNLEIITNNFHFNGSPSPDRIQLTNIDVNLSDGSDRSWEFPSYLGFYFSDSNIQASENFCFGFGYIVSGSCFSAGNFGSYSGSYENGKLTMVGGKDGGFDLDSNNFQFTLVAHAVPEPNTSGLFFAGLGIIAIAQKRRFKINS